ncbi:hypothetical protein [Streptomyces sp. BE133]|uniref:hypothetical protein n=1 Tax=Streptomyces sp. BE133 TaxID=3002523 RepID=UPI002E786A79|nr:hypothetical protein [Streptomyces sp. BE133]MEE1808114.1 hypothetical protein [Streptomyces sp. BE133]
MAGAAQAESKKEEPKPELREVASLLNAAVSELREHVPPAVIDALPKRRKEGKRSKTPLDQQDIAELLSISNSSLSRTIRALRAPSEKVPGRIVELIEEYVGEERARELEKQLADAQRRAHQQKTLLVGPAAGKGQRPRWRSAVIFLAVSFMLIGWLAPAPPPDLTYKSGSRPRITADGSRIKEMRWTTTQHISTTLEIRQHHVQAGVRGKLRVEPAEECASHQIAPQWTLKTDDSTAAQGTLNPSEPASLAANWVSGNPPKTLTLQIRWDKRSCAFITASWEDVRLLPKYTEPPPVF